MAKEQRTGIIDTLSSAYGLVNRWPALMVVPVLLDVFFWFGPRLSVDGLLLGLSDRLAAQQPQPSQEVLDVLRASAGQTDLFAVLAMQVPSMVRLLSPVPAALGASRPEIAVTDPWMAVALAVLLLLLALVLVSLYIVPIACVVRDGRPGWRVVGRAVARTWLRQVALYGLIIAAALAVIVPLSVIAALLGAAGLALLQLLLIVIQTVAIALIVLLYFSVDAIALSDVGPLRAMWYSANVVRRNFWSALGLIALITIIAVGMAMVFVRLGSLPFGVPIAIAANAYIRTGLVAASLLFYRDRLAVWERQRRAAALNRS